VLVVLHIQIDRVRRHGKYSKRTIVTTQLHNSNIIIIMCSCIVSGIFRIEEKGQSDQLTPSVPPFAHAHRNVDLRQIHCR